MLHVLAYITAKPGMRETVLREFRANMPAVHAEEACIEYVPVVDLRGIRTFLDRTWARHLCHGREMGEP